MGTVDARQAVTQRLVAAKLTQSDARGRMSLDDPRATRGGGDAAPNGIQGLLPGARGAAQAGQAAPDTDFSQWFSGQRGGPRVEYREFGGDTGEFSDFFESLFGDRAGMGRRGRASTRPMPQRGEDYEYGVEISLEEADR